MSPKPYAVSQLHLSPGFDCRSAEGEGVALAIQLWAPLRKKHPIVRV